MELAAHNNVMQCSSEMLSGHHRKSKSVSILQANICILLTIIKHILNILQGLQLFYSATYCNYSILPFLQDPGTEYQEMVEN